MSWTPRGARYDLTRRTGRRTRALLRNAPRTRARVKLRSGHRYRVRVRMRAASGKPGRWASRGVRVLRCLRAPRARPGHGRM